MNKNEDKKWMAKKVRQMRGNSNNEVAGKLGPCKFRI